VEEQKSNTPDSNCTELFVRNLAWSVDENKLEAFFSNYGTVLSKKIVMDRNTGKPKGIGFVEFSSREEAQAALNDGDNFTIEGRLATATFSDNKPERTGPSGFNQGGQGGRGGYQGGQDRQQGGYQKSSFAGEKFTAFVGNLAWKSNEDSLKKFFSKCGNVVDVRIAKNEEGKMKGFAHVDFDSQDAVNKAKAMAGQDLDGREIRVDESTPRQGGDRGGFRGGRGGDRGGRGGFGGGRGGRGGYGNPMDRAKKAEH